MPNSFPAIPLHVGEGDEDGLSPSSLKVALGERVKLVGILYHREPRKLPMALGLKNSLQNQGSQISARSRSGRLKVRHTYIVPSLHHTSWCRYSGSSSLHCLSHQLPGPTTLLPSVTQFTSLTFFNPTLTADTFSTYCNFHLHGCCIITKEK